MSINPQKDKEITVTLQPLVIPCATMSKLQSHILRISGILWDRDPLCYQTSGKYVSQAYDAMSAKIISDIDGLPILTFDIARQIVRNNFEFANSKLPEPLAGDDIADWGETVNQLAKYLYTRK